MSFGFLRTPIAEQVIRIIVLLCTIVLHELGHGCVALAMGDPTAKNEGRLTLNPLKHLDPLGTICMLFFRFGWAKPIPINSLRFHNQKIGMFLVSIAGITVNMILAFLSSFFVVFWHDSVFVVFFRMMLIYNVFFAIFNALPIPPLDGSKILASCLPRSWMNRFFEMEKYLYVILIVLMFSNLLSRILNPIAEYIINSFFYFWGGILL